MNKIEKLMNSLPAGIDCALITSGINRRYFSGMKSSDGTVVVFKEKAYLIIDSRYYEKACAVVDSCEVILQGSLFLQIKQLLQKHSAKTAAVETHSMTLHQLADYQKQLPEVLFDTSDALSNAINALRIVKEKSEIEKIIQAQRIAEKAFENVLNHIKPGKTEREIALTLDNYMIQGGAEAISFDTIMLSGKNTSLPHGVPSEKKLFAGEFVLIDFGAVYEGYHSDMTRTFCLGEASDEMRSVYNIVLEAQTTSIKAIKAGVKGREVDKIARDIIVQNGYGENFGHSLGHGVGMEIHESPNASPKSDSVFEENMIITAEPGIYIPQKFGVRIEDFVVVTKEGCDNMTKTAKELMCL